MTPSQVIQLQALKLKSTIDGHHPAMMESIIANPENAEGLKKDFRNVCALIPSMQFDDLESLCGLLDMSKREVIGLALSVFIPMAHAIVKEVNPFENEAAIKALEAQ